MEVEVEKKPFWVSNEEVSGLQGTPQDDLSEKLAEAIPEMTEVSNSRVVGEYGFKDGILIYHIYHPERKIIFDDANEAMDQIRTLENDPAKVTEKQSHIAQTANAALDKTPWWPETEQMLDEVFTVVFKYAPHKVSFYKEVDAWSVILPDSVFPMRPQKSMLERPFIRIAARLMS